MRDLIRIGTRGSALALAQANWLKGALEGLAPGSRIELVTIRTSGDRFIDRPLRSVGGKGLFVTEIEDALAEGKIDCAIHSMKDVPAEIHPRLLIAAIPPREDAGDVLISRGGCDLASLPAGARVGTCSLRRTALLRAERRDLEIVELRGNVDTRLRRWREGYVDALVLAAAGLRRLGLEVPEARPFDQATFVPAIGQGALAVETRNDDVAELIARLDDRDTRDAVLAERAFLARTGGSCHTPIAAHATVASETVSLQAVIARPDGSEIVRGDRAATRSQAEALGRLLAEALLSNGGEQIIAALITEREPAGS